MSPAATGADALRPRRSVLYMPAANARSLEKAKSIPADSLIFDLEDAVAPDAKDVAREQAAALPLHGVVEDPRGAPLPPESALRRDEAPLEDHLRHRGGLEPHLLDRLPDAEPRRVAVDEA